MDKSLDINLLTKQQVMQLFAIRDRTFYSWIEKGILFPVSEDGLKKYDITKALVLKNIDPNDIAGLLARPVVKEASTKESQILPVSPKNDELVGNLKSQLETVRAELTDERNSSKTLLARLGVLETQQKMIADIHSNEAKMMDLAKSREEKLLISFQDKMNTLVEVTREKDDEKNDQFFNKISSLQSEKEQGLKLQNKNLMIFASIGMLLILLGAILVVYNKNLNISLKEKQRELLQNEKDELVAKHALALEDKQKAIEVKVLDKEKKFAADLQIFKSDLEKRIEDIKELNTSKIDLLKDLKDKEQKIIETQLKNQKLRSEQKIKDLMGQKNSAEGEISKLKAKLDLWEIKLQSTMDELKTKKSSKEMSEEISSLKNMLGEIHSQLNEQKKTQDLKNLIPKIEDSLE